MDDAALVARHVVSAVMTHRPRTMHASTMAVVIVVFAAIVALDSHHRQNVGIDSFDLVVVAARAAKVAAAAADAPTFAEARR